MNDFTPIDWSSCSLMRPESEINEDVECGGLWARMHAGARYPDIEPVEDIDYEEINETKITRKWQHPLNKKNS